jgi:hypothetical protein
LRVFKTGLRYVDRPSGKAVLLARSLLQCAEKCRERALRFLGICHSGETQSLPECYNSRIYKVGTLALIEFRGAACHLARALIGKDTFAFRWFR